MSKRRTMLAKEAIFRLQTTYPTLLKLAKAGHVHDSGTVHAREYSREDVEAIVTSAQAAGMTLRQMIRKLINTPKLNVIELPTVAVAAANTTEAVVLNNLLRAVRRIEGQVNRLAQQNDALCRVWNVPPMEDRDGTRDTH